MKHILLLFLVMISGFAVNAQIIVYDENAEIRTVEPFTSVEVSGAMFAYITQADVQGLAVSAGEAKYNNKIKTEVKNGVLRIWVDGGVWNSFNWINKKLKAYITVTKFNRLEVSGATYVSLNGAVKSDSFNLEVSGASEVKGIVDVHTFRVDMSGASEARLSGSVTNGFIDASGACRFRGYDLSMDTCVVSSSGASDIRVTVNRELTADASGGSAIFYKGPGVVKSLNASSGSYIKNRNGNND